ncbi:MAG: SMC-Scp complex subunit ScpB, partial [Oscillospiraceae bacterium]|nr:SMC-Scp complex subunit ScpB [Oscillospiraceae bacterium]
LEVPGRPVLYGTTSNFLRCFSLNSLDELPELPENDREVLMSDVENGQLSLFEGDNEKSDDEAPKGTAEPTEEVNKE